jgi:glycosyltransferase involved in cell wall biosynthesis
MRLSFVIPAYNEEHYIARCLDAITTAIGGPERAQGKDADYEIIVVDNNSTDGTAAVAGRYHYVTLLHEPRPGANRARETGFEASHGDLVAFLDSDTEVVPGWIARVQGEFALDPKLVCVSGPFVFYDLPVAMRILTRTFDCLSWAVYFVNRFILHVTSAIQGGGAVVRSSALRAIGGHNTDLKFYGDDADLAKRLNKVGKVVFSFRFSLRSSGRRIAKEGVLTMGMRYTLNYFWITLFNRPFTTVSAEVRFPDGASGIAKTPHHDKRVEFVIILGAVVCFCLLGATIAYFVKTW